MAARHVVDVEAHAAANPISVHSCFKRTIIPSLVRLVAGLLERLIAFVT